MKRFLLRGMDKSEIVKYIKDLIVKDKLQARQRITETQVCQELNVGRSKVREALRHLEQEGFVEIIPNSGAIVKELSQKDIVQIYDIMGVLEGLSMRIATHMISEEEIQKIEELVIKMEENRDNKFLLSQYNMEFHTLLTQLGGNERLIEFMKNIREHTQRMRLQTFYNEEQVKASLREHRLILKAIKERKPIKVENVIRKHFLDSKNRLVKSLNSTL